MSGWAQRDAEEKEEQQARLNSGEDVIVSAEELERLQKRAESAEAEIASVYNLPLFLYDSPQPPLVVYLSKKINEIFANRDKWKRRAKLFREAYRDKDVEAFNLNLHKIVLEDALKDASKAGTLARGIANRFIAENQELTKSNQALQLELADYHAERNCKACDGSGGQHDSEPDSELEPCDACLGSGMQLVADEFAERLAMIEGDAETIQHNREKLAKVYAPLINADTNEQITSLQSSLSAAQRERDEISMRVTKSALELMAAGFCDEHGEVIKQMGFSEFQASELVKCSGCLSSRINALQAEIEKLQKLNADLDKSESQLIDERDRAQDALQETHIALGGDGEWVGRTYHVDPPDSGDLHLDVPALALQIKALSNRLEADNKDLRIFNESMAESTSKLWQIIAPDYEGDCNIHQMAQSLVDDRDEWKQQHENLLSIYQAQTHALALMTSDRDDWKREWEMYANAWKRELGGRLLVKTHAIDALVLTTQELFKEKNGLESQLQMYADNTDSILTRHILMKWDREKIERFALHLLGDEWQEKAATLADREKAIKFASAIFNYHSKVSDTYEKHIWRSIDDRRIPVFVLWAVEYLLSKEVIEAHPKRQNFYRWIGTK